MRELLLRLVPLQLLYEQLTHDRFVYNKVIPRITHYRPARGHTGQSASTLKPAQNRATRPKLLHILNLSGLSGRGTDPLQAHSILARIIRTALYITITNEHEYAYKNKLTELSPASVLYSVVNQKLGKLHLSSWPPIIFIFAND